MSGPSSSLMSGPSNGVRVESLCFSADCWSTDTSRSSMLSNVVSSSDALRERDPSSAPDRRSAGPSLTFSFGGSACVVLSSSLDLDPSADSKGSMALSLLLECVISLIRPSTRGELCDVVFLVAPGFSLISSLLMAS